MKKLLTAIFLGIILIILTTPFSFASSPFDLATWKTKTVSSDSSLPSGSQIAAGKIGYGIVWTDDRESDSELYFVLMNNGGERVGGELKLTDNGVHDLTPAIVWNGDEYGIFWSHDRSQIYFMRVSAQGKKLTGEIPVVTTTAGYAIHVSAVWNGEEYGVTWWDARNSPGCDPSGTRGRAFFVRASSMGEKIGNEIPAADVFSNTWQDYKPLIDWDGQNYGIFWNDSREAGNCFGSDQNIYYSKINETGEKVLGDIKLQKADTGYSQLESVASDGQNHAITYRGSVTRAYLAQMNSAGDTLSSDIPINTEGFGGGTQISLIDGNYYVSWSDGRNRTDDTFYNTEIYFTKFDKNGNKLLPETRLTHQEDPSNENSPIVSINGKLGLTWKETPIGGPQIKFAINNQIP